MTCVRAAGKERRPRRVLGHGIRVSATDLGPSRGIRGKSRGCRPLYPRLQDRHQVMREMLGFGLRTILKKHYEVIVRYIGMQEFWLKNNYEAYRTRNIEVYKILLKTIILMSIFNNYEGNRIPYTFLWQNNTKIKHYKI